MIRTVIADDEKWTLLEITQMVQSSGYLQVVKAYNSPEKLLEEIEETRPEVAFIDVEMPGMDGITLANKLLERNPAVKIVLITAYRQYAVKAFDLNALDYLLKPICPERFQVMLGRIAATVLNVPHANGGGLEISCFGDLKVMIDGRSVRWERSKAEELFAFLLMHHRHGVHKEMILEELWPDYGPRKSAPILQTSAWKLRSIFAPLKDAVKLEYSGNRYCLTLTNCVCDLFQVEAALDNNLEIVEGIAPLVRRGFLSGQGYLWALAKEEELKNKLHVALRVKADEYFTGGDIHAAIRLLKILLSNLPFDEDANNELLKCFAKIKDGAGLVEYYKRLEEGLRKDYDMAPPESTQSLYLELNKLMRN